MAQHIDRAIKTVTEAKAKLSMATARDKVWAMGFQVAMSILDDSDDGLMPYQAQDILSLIMVSDPHDLKDIKEYISNLGHTLTGYDDEAQTYVDSIYSYFEKSEDESKGKWLLTLSDGSKAWGGDAGWIDNLDDAVLLSDLQKKKFVRQARRKGTLASYEWRLEDYG